MATMRDVAKAAGVSIATVSSTLSRSAYVSPELQARVNIAIESLGYERNSMASGLKRGRTSLIGLIVSDVTNPFFTELVDHVQAAARESGLSVLLGISNHDVVRETELLRLMRSQQAAGTILCPAGDARRELAVLGRMKLVAVDNAAPTLGCDTVTIDNRRAAALAARHCLEHGHRKIAVVAGPEGQYVSRERLSGFADALAEGGVDLPSTFILRGAFRIEEAYRAVEALLASSNLPTALFVSNNLMLIGVMRALADAGLSVPRHMSVVSIDDFPWASAFQPALTVVRQPVAALARLALDQLVRRLGGDDRPPTHACLEANLVVRGSCAAPTGHVA